jgi:DNA polymerase-3 subunit epsilon
MFDRLFRRKGHGAADAQASEPLRWVVLDTETTGLNVKRDRLLSIAAVGVHLQPGLKAAKIQVADSFDAIIGQDSPTACKQNILIHHIGVGAQAQGARLTDVLQAFSQWVGDAPLFAYHADFDEAIIKNAYKQAGLPPLSNRWVDVAPLTNAMFKDIANTALDERIARLGLQCIARHDAVGDTFVTAELLLRMLPRLRAQAQSFADIERVAVDHTRY